MFYKTVSMEKHWPDVDACCFQSPFIRESLVGVSPPQRQDEGDFIFICSPQLRGQLVSGFERVTWQTAEGGCPDPQPPLLGIAS